MRRAAVPKREFLNALDAALARLPVGSFKIAVENGHAAILPFAGVESPPSAEAPDAWDKALDKWRRSA